MAYDETIKKDTTSKIVEVTLRDSTSGNGKTGLASGSVTAYYCREGGTATLITLAAGTAGDAYSSGKWAEVDGTNQRGLYQFHIPDAALASGVNAVTITFQASGTIDKSMRISLIGLDVRDTVDGGLSNLDAAISTRSAFDPVTDTVTTDAASRNASKADVSGLSTFDPVTDTVANVTTVATCTTNADMRGTDNALLASSAPVNFSNLAITASTGFVTGVTNNVNAEVSSLSTIALAQFIGQDIGIYSLTEGSVLDTLRDAVNNPSSGLLVDMAGSTFNSATDSLEAIRDRGDAAWTTGSGGGGGDATLANQTTIINTLSDMSGATFNTLTDSLEAIRDRGDAGWVTGGGGGGIWQLTVTVTDTSANAVQGARVAVDGTSLTVTTDTNGEAVLNLNDGSYTLNVSAPSGYDDPAAQSVTISGADGTLGVVVSPTASSGCEVPPL